MKKYLKGFKNKKNNVFSLVELMIVMAIIGVLMAMLVPSIAGYIDTANKRSVEAGARGIETAIISYEIDNKKALTVAAGTTTANFTAALGDYFSGDGAKLQGTSGTDDGAWTISWTDGTGGSTGVYTIVAPVNFGVTSPDNTFTIKSQYASQP